MTLQALVVYFSPGGNTKKVAEAIVRGLESRGVDTTIVDIKAAEDISFADYDLVCIGAPAYNFALPEPMQRFYKRRLRQVEVKLTAPASPGKWGVAFVTYAGPHTGIAEAIPAGDCLAQFLRHLGIGVRDTWFTVGEFHREPGDPINEHGYLGDIRGRPDEHDLAVIERNAAGLAHVLQHEKELAGAG